MKRYIYNKGMTFIELMVTLSIFSLMLLAMTAFQRSVFYLNGYAHNGIASAQDARIILRDMVKELRSTSPGNNGASPIVQTATSSINFFSDTDGDGLKEEIRYYLIGTILKRGSIKPTGTPLIYDQAQEVTTILAANIKNGTSTDLFQYYDSSYTGTSSPLAQPVAVNAVRLVKINLVIDVDQNRAPVSTLYTSQVTLRNLKDNL